VDADVVIAGAGPTGLMLACELRLAGIRPLVLERLPSPTGLSKALALVGRSVDTLDYRGLLGRFQERAAVAIPNAAHFALIPLDLAKAGDLGLRGIFIQQAATEEILNARARELGVPIRRGHELTALTQDADGVTIQLTGPDGTGTLSAKYLVGCDGGASPVRRQAGIDFPGLPPTSLLRLGDVTLEAGVTPADLPDLRVPVIPLGGGYFRVITVEPYDAAVDRDAPMTLAELNASIRRVNGRDLPISGTRWVSRFTDSSRQAAQYRTGRVLVAGDAAHIHLPAGGPGLNTGLQDAVNLGWKLAAQVHGWAPPGLLDSYHRERHAEGERVLLHTRAQGALTGAAADGRIAALREVVAQLLQYQQPLRHLVNLMYGLDTRYETSASDTGSTDTGAANPHPLAGRWAPNLALATTGGAASVAELLHQGRGVLLDLTPDGGYARAGQGWRDRIDIRTAKCPSPPASALLIRPDGYVAWAGATDTGDDGTLRGALATWFGAPKAG
jgi:2-polyprenyl-6-methoxyphenol hydroxylase-like FAD-dependent oxidoreductase